MNTPRFTGIRLLSDNAEAWQAKRALIASAKHSLELAYFIVEVDGSTCCLMLDLMAAAERGVKVRLLADYYMTYGQAPALRTLAGCANIEVRRYRPPTAQWLEALRSAKIDPELFVKGLMATKTALIVEALKENTVFPLSLLADIRGLRTAGDESRVEFALRILATLRGMVASGKAESDSDDVMTGALEKLATIRAKLRLDLEIIKGLIQFLHRTHHKLLLADGRRFIMGGRNLGDVYQFGDPPAGRPFVDTDVWVEDSLNQTHEHAQAFNALWNSPVSIDLAGADPLDDRPALAVEQLRDTARQAEARPHDRAAMAGRHLPDMDGEIVNNLPSDEGDAAITRAYIARIRAFTARGRPGVIDIVSAYLYLVDDDADGPELFELRQCLLEAARAGITVNIRTNSITTTDLRPVNRAAYPKLIELVDGGVNVFELKDGQGSLHAKAAAIGDEWLMVGSYNMDPRSELYDTNNLIVFRDATGVATAAFRETRVDGLLWTRLTPESVRELAAASQQRHTNFAHVRRLL